MKNLLVIALGGALGAVTRYALSGWTHQLLGTAFPYGTFIVNLTGCFLLGFVAQIGLTTTEIPETLGIAVRIGFLGALTTFSTFSYETIRQLESGQWSLALVNVGGSVLMGLIGVWGGLVIARWLVGP